MKKLFLHILKNIPLILLSIGVAVFIWIFATISSDPTEEGRFSNLVTIETVGLADDMVITSGLPYSVSINLRAPNSIWRRISLERVTAKAIIDVTGLEPGTHQVPIDIRFANQTDVLLRDAFLRQYIAQFSRNGIRLGRIEIPLFTQHGNSFLSVGSVCIGSAVHNGVSYGSSRIHFCTTFRPFSSFQASFSRKHTYIVHNFPCVVNQRTGELSF